MNIIKNTNVNQVSANPAGRVIQDVKRVPEMIEIKILVLELPSQLRKFARMKFSFIFSFYSWCFFVCAGVQVKVEKTGNGFYPDLGLITCGRSIFADITANKQIVTAYLAALKNFDHEKMKSFIDLSIPFPDKTMKEYRDFERNMRTP